MCSHTLTMKANLREEFNGCNHLMMICWWCVDDLMMIWWYNHLMMIWYQGTQKVHQLFYEKIKQASLVCTKIIDTLPTIDHIWLIINQNCFALFSKNLCQQQQHRWEQSVRNELQSANNICKTRSICTPGIFCTKKYEIWQISLKMWNSSCIQSLWSWKSFVSKFALQDRWRKAEKQESWEMFAFSCFGQRIFCSENSFIFFGRKIFSFFFCSGFIQFWQKQRDCFSICKNDENLTFTQMWCFTTNFPGGAWDGHWSKGGGCLKIWSV